MERRRGEPVAAALTSLPSPSATAQSLTAPGEVTGIPQPFDPLLSTPSLTSNDRPDDDAFNQSRGLSGALEASSRETVGSKTSKDEQDVFGGSTAGGGGPGAGSYAGYSSAARLHNANYYDKKWSLPSK